jgi:hypothetical protein
MRTTAFIFCGFLVWATCLAGARLISGSAASFLTATIVFLVLWFLVAAVNLWVGVSKAGYAFSEELPIFLHIFLLPALAAIFIKWKWL